jgi:hypothetical protein
MYFIELGINRIVGIAELFYSGVAASPHNICVFHNRMRLTPLSRSRNAKSQFGRHLCSDRCVQHRLKAARLREKVGRGTRYGGKQSLIPRALLRQALQSRPKQWPASCRSAISHSGSCVKMRLTRDARAA